LTHYAVDIAYCATFLDIVADDERIFLDTALLVLLTRDIKKNTRRN